MDVEKIKNIVNSYNLNPGIIRSTYVDNILKYVGRKEIIVLKGIRRCGKSTIMKQLIKNIGEKNCVYVNLDDYGFLGNWSFDLLENILQIYSNKKYFFFDEIQNIEGFERWLRTHYDRESKYKFIVGGSNSKIMSKDLGTLLTGRCLVFEIKPLSFKEFNSFSDGGLDEFLKYGGFPEVVLEKDVEKKKTILSNYFDIILEKDVVQKYGIQHHKQLKELLRYIMLNPGIRVSMNKLSKQLGVSINTVKSYLKLAEEVYLIFEVPFFSYSAKTKFVESRISKYYVIDSGFYWIFSARFEKSKLYENAVALHFFDKRFDLYYWSGKNEVDFINSNIAINVVSSKDIPQREFLGLNELDVNQITNKFIIGSFNDESKNVVSLETFLSR